MSGFYPALDQQRGEGLADYVARLEKEQAMPVVLQPAGRHKAVCDHLGAATERLRGLPLERAKAAVAGPCRLRNSAGCCIG